MKYYKLAFTIPTKNTRYLENVFKKIVSLWEKMQNNTKEHLIKSKWLAICTLFMNGEVYIIMVLILSELIHKFKQFKEILKLDYW